MPSNEKGYMRNYYLNNKEKFRIATKKAKKKRVEFYKEYKKKLFCAECGISFKHHPEICDFHHILEKGNMKERAFLSIILIRGKKQFFKEIKKTIPLCANCHRIVHYNKNK